MGGYGALLLGARFAEKFSAISAHSAITKLEQMEQFVEEPIAAYTTDLPNVIDAMKINQYQLPPIRFDGGRKDTLLEPNRLLHQQLLDLNIEHSYQEFKGGHEWAYWQVHVEKTLRFFDKAI